jgi:hypothetical protein
MSVRIAVADMGYPDCASNRLGMPDRKVFDVFRYSIFSGKWALQLIDSDGHFNGLLTQAINRVTGLQW